jgi:DNA ligase-1
MKPMRGVKFTKTTIEETYLVSPKIDGMRAVIKDGFVLSKTLKPIPNRQVQRMFSHLHGFDGELTVGPAHMEHADDDVFNRSRGILMRKGEIADADIRLHVFDRWDLQNVPAIDRVMATSNAFGTGIEVVQHYKVSDFDTLSSIEGTMIVLGYEGAMLRKATAPYKYGVSTENEAYLLKLKRFVDGEAVVIGTVEQMENTNEATTDELGYTNRSTSKAGMVGKNTLGAFVVKDLETEVVFEIGGGKGMTNELRERLWAIRETLPGTILTYTYQEVGTKDKPRLPQLKGVRPLFDLCLPGVTT